MLVVKYKDFFNSSKPQKSNNLVFFVLLNTSVGVEYVHVSEREFGVF